MRARKKGVRECWHTEKEGGLQALELYTLEQKAGSMGAHNEREMKALLQLFPRKPEPQCGRSDESARLGLIAGSPGHDDNAAEASDSANLAGDDPEYCMH